MLNIVNQQYCIRMKRLLGLLIVGLSVVAFTVDNPEEFIKKISSRFLLKMATYPQEKVYLQTDKPHYVAGEKIWFRAYLVNAITHIPSEDSRYVYVELTNRQDSVLQRVKVARQDSVFQGYLQLPLEIPQGDYILRAYSYVMQSVGEDYLFKKQIRVVNPRRTAAQVGTIRKETKTQPVQQNKVTENLRDIDIAFFPEGGNLLTGVRQTVAFKAIDQDGMPVKVSGVIENAEGDTISYLITLHDGMGWVKLPVYEGMHYKARVRTTDGFEKVVNLPEAKSDGIGIRLVKSDTIVKYAVVKSQNAVVPSDLYVMIHTRGFVYCVLPVNEFPQGEISTREMLEGIAHIVLFDSQCRVWSQRLCFVRRPDKPELKLKADKGLYYHRELANLELGFGANERSKLEGSFSVSVVSDQKVNESISHTNILSELLLTSDLKGYIESPDYYFEDTNRMVDRDLDLVMLTHGWTRFDVEKEMKGEISPAEFYVEKGQFLAGHVKNFSGKKNVQARLLILSTAGHVQMVDADSAGRFILEGIEYYDSTRFVIQATKQNGRYSVEVFQDVDSFLKVINFFPYYPESKKKESDFFSRYGQNYYYENGVKVYILEEAIVRRQVQRHYYSPVERQCVAYLDSAAIAGMRELDIRQIIERMGHGIEVGNTCVTHLGRDTLAVIINDLPIMDFSELALLQAEHVYRISYINAADAYIFYGDRINEFLGQKLSHSGGLLYLTVDPVHRISRLDHPSLATFQPLGIQRSAAFYSPRYGRSNPKGSSHEPDERSTIYWNPVVNITKDSTVCLSFYTADLSGLYTVTVEGVTTGGEVLRKKIKMRIK